PHIYPHSLHDALPIYKIAGVQQISHVTMHPLQSGLISYAAMSVLNDFIDNCAAADSRDGRLARSVHVCDDHPVGVVEGAAEFARDRKSTRLNSSHVSI